MTLEEFGISMGQVIYVEYSNNNNQWPTDKVGAGPVSGQKTTTPTPNNVERNRVSENQKTVGLYNLGNSKRLLL